MIGETEEKLIQTLQVIARAGQRKTEGGAKILDYKDRLREERRAARLIAKGY